jgi:hypothetical protein
VNALLLVDARAVALDAQENIRGFDGMLKRCESSSGQGRTFALAVLDESNWAEVGVTFGGLVEPIEGTWD